MQPKRNVQVCVVYIVCLFFDLLTLIVCVSVWTGVFDWKRNSGSRNRQPFFANTPFISRKIFKNTFFVHYHIDIIPIMHNCFVFSSFILFITFAAFKCKECIVPQTCTDLLSVCNSYKTALNTFSLYSAHSSCITPNWYWWVSCWFGYKCSNEHYLSSYLGSGMGLCAGRSRQVA